LIKFQISVPEGGCRDRVVVTTYAISIYHYKSCELKSHSWLGVLDTTLCDKVCQ